MIFKEEKDVIKKRREVRIKQSALNIIVLIAVLCLLLYVAVQLFGRSSTMVSTQRTQMITDVEYSYGKGYIFKDETVVTVDGGVVDYLARDGARIGVGQAYADVYSATGISADEREEIQKSISDLSQRISMLDSGVGGKTEISDLASVGESLLQSYYSYIDLISRGELPAADAKGELLLDAIVDYRVITGRDGVAESIISSLEEEKQTMLTKLGSPRRMSSENKGFYFYHGVDGYEEIFSSLSLENMTAEQLDNLTTEPRKEYSGVIVGKQTHTAKWYLAIPIDESATFSFSHGRSYDVSFTHSGRTIDMLLEKIYVGEDGSYLLFSCYDLSLSEGFSRAQDVKIYMGSSSGYRIPKEALTTLYNEKGVYILVGSSVEFRRVAVIGEGNLYYIANTYESDAAEGNVSDIPYLSINDLIITSGNDLYDGKTLD